MAAIPSQRTWVTGEVVTAAYFNDDLRDAVNFLKAVPMASVWNSASNSIPNGGAGGNLTWDTEEHDVDATHLTGSNPERLTIVTPGKYQAVLDVVWQASVSAVGYTDVRINANIGATNRLLARDVRAWYGHASIPGSAATLTHPPLVLAAGDYFYASAIHGLGSALNIAGGQYVGTRFGLHWLGE